MPRLLLLWLWLLWHLRREALRRHLLLLRELLLLLLCELLAALPRRVEHPVLRAGRHHAPAAAPCPCAS